MQLRTTSAQWDEIIFEVAFLFQSKYCRMPIYVLFISRNKIGIKIKIKGTKIGWIKTVLQSEVQMIQKVIEKLPN